MSTYARTYNQAHITRPHNGDRRVSIYWSWSYPWRPNGTRPCCTTGSPP